ncbi:transcriptional regulator [Streptomyces sp. NPDC014864]|uniref:transcriptional regulator n=1 Tax=Streptomyces sp. NPDC014864 TaxID=3364924 RepID=UPI0037033BB6
MVGPARGRLRLIRPARSCPPCARELTEQERRRPQLAAASRALDRAGFAIIATGLQQCVTGIDADEGTGEDTDQIRTRLERLFLSLA